MIVSAASSTNTIMQLDQRGRDFGAAGSVVVRHRLRLCFRRHRARFRRVAAGIVAAGATGAADASELNELMPPSKPSRKKIRAVLAAWAAAGT
jgi:hypothetical protein